MAALDQFKGLLENFKSFWGKLSQKVKRLIIISFVAILATAVVITVVMNAKASEYSILFSGITATEASEVYAVLQERGVGVQMNSRGQVLVPTSQLDALIFDMAAEGYPKTAPPYDSFWENISTTSTDYERQKAYIFALQDRIQTTLVQKEEIKKAIVTINVPEQTGLAWSSTDTASSASVMLTLNGDISNESVDTIKKLVAASVPNCKAENVVVTDTATNIDLGESDDLISYTLQQFDYERKLSKRAEDAVKTLYSPSYGADGITVAAAFEIDTDKMKEESKTYYKTEDGDQMMSHFDESYVAEGGIPVGGLVGEENNTDVPDYVADGTATTDDIISYDRSIDFENSYVLRQIERGTAPIKASSITLLLNDSNLTAARQDEIAMQVSRATGIAVENVNIGSMTPLNPADIETGTTPENPLFSNPVLLLAAAGGLLLICMMAIVIPVMLRRKRKKKELERLRAAEAEEAEAAEAAMRAQAEIDMHKNKLKYQAEAQLIQDNSMTEEIRNFAKDNPEMTATLIRSLLKEEG